MVSRCLDDASLWLSIAMDMGSDDVYHFQNKIAKAMVLDPICLGFKMIK